MPALAALTALAALAALGFGTSGLHASWRMADALPDALEGRDVVATGVVASLPQRSAAGLRFRFQVDGAVLDGREVRLPQALAVGWYRGPHDDAGRPQPQAELRAGQRWRLTLRPKQPHGGLNPYGFDYELQLFEQGLRGTAYVRDAPAPRLLHRAAGFPVERLRQRVRDAIEASVPDRRAAGVLAALSVGDQGAIDRDDWDLYRNTGIAHLVSISGLHITMFAWLAGGLIDRLWRRSRRLALCVAAPVAARWGGIVCAAAYALFSGGGVPSQRTVWMLAVVTVLQTLGVRWPWPLVLLTSAVAVTVLDPWALMQAGFWLSFAAVGLLMASSSQRKPAGAASPETPTGWRGWPARISTALRADLRTQVIATIGLTPLTLVFFQQVSVVGFAANLIAIPVITLVVTPLALLGIGLVPLWAAGAWVVRQLDTALTALAAMPGAVWSVPVAPAWAQLAGLAGALLLVLPIPWRARALAVPLLVPLLMPPRSPPETGRFDLAALDIGQGTAVVIRTRSHLLVFDTGPQYSQDSDAGQRVVLPYLRALGIARIDRLVLSHRDLDHVGGARSILAAMPVDDLRSSLEDGHPLLALAAGPTRCHAGQQWEWDGVRFEVLRPDEGDYARSLKSNAMSCVVRVEGASLRGLPGASVLLTGDIEREQEAALIEAGRDKLRSDLLVVPHHGSKTSSTGAFLDAVRPRLAIFQAGYRNRFGHPAAEVLARYRERGIAVAITPACGAFVRTSSDDRIAASVHERAVDAAEPKAGAPDGFCHREVARRYWHHRLLHDE